MTEQRKNYFDYLRVLACCTVVMTHVFVTAKTDFPNHSLIEDNISQIVAWCLHFAVPIFFMITGALFLKKKDEINIKIYFKKYILKYLLAIFTFGWGFAIIEEIFNKNFSAIMPLTALINTIEGNTWNHMWYLYTLVGIMAFIPIVKIIVEKNAKWLKYILLLLFISSFIFPLISTYTGKNIGIEIPIKSEYLTYVILGYFLSEKRDNISKLKLACVMVLCFIILGISVYLYQIRGISYFQSIGDYNSLVIMLLSISIFLIFKSINFKSNKLILDISCNSYGIYLIHMFWINFIYKFLEYNIYGNLIILKTLVVFISVLILSLISTKMIKKFPLINKII